jgi:hypothetical protein
MKKIGMKIFNATNWIMAILFFVTASSGEDVSWYQIMVCALCLMYLCCALYISNALENKRG